MALFQQYCASGKLEAYINKAIQEWGVPGISLGILEKGKLIYAKGYGVKKIGRRAPVNKKTIFQTGSIAKSFTATLVAMLIEEGRFSWKDRVRDLLPRFRLHDMDATVSFAVEDLMSQCSGLPAYSGRLMPHLGFSRTQIIDKLQYIKPSNAFRSQYAYQNILFLVAAALVEKHTGQTWEENLSIRILQPLDMKFTTANLESYRNCTNTALGHYSQGLVPDTPLTVIPKSWPYYDWIYTYAPAGGLNSNVLDLATWLKLNLEMGKLNKKNLISREALSFLHTPKTYAGKGVWGEPRHYCQGWLQSEYKPYPILWHNGGTSGMKSILAIVPEADIGIVILCNLHESLLPEALCRFLLDRFFGHPWRDWSRELLEKQIEETASLTEPPEPDIPPRPLHLYSGIYCSNLYGEVSVSNLGTSLFVTLGPRKIKNRLRHWGGDTFILNWPGVLNNGAGVHFFANRTGKAKALRIEGMHDDLLGVFVRKGLKLNTDWLKKQLEAIKLPGYEDNGI